MFFVLLAAAHFNAIDKTSYRIGMGASAIAVFWNAAEDIKAKKNDLNLK